MSTLSNRLKRHSLSGVRQANEQCRSGPLKLLLSIPTVLFVESKSCSPQLSRV